MLCLGLCLCQGIATEIAMVDADASKLTAEAMDMQYGQGFVKNAKVVGSSGKEIANDKYMIYDCEFCQLKILMS